MESQQPPLAALCLLGVLVTSCLGSSHWEDTGFQVELQGSNTKCQGQVMVSLDGAWHTVDSRSWGQNPDRREDPKKVSTLCRKLNCGDALALAYIPYFNRPQKQITCQGQLGSFSSCNNSWNQGDPLGLICLEPLKTTPPTTRPPPTTPAPPRLQLVPEPGGLRCAGVVEFYLGSRGGTVRSEDQDRTEDLGNRICEVVRCGSFLRYLPEVKAARTQAPGDSSPLPIQWAIQNSSCASLEQCFRKVQSWEDDHALALVCSDFQPKVQSRLVGSGSVCAGSVEVRQHGQWAALCHSHSSTSRWEEVCQEQQCGQLNSYRVLDAGEKTSRGLLCPQDKLSQCHQLQEKRSHCKRVFISCQDPNPAGLGTGTVLSIILALVLLGVLLVMCGPLVYKKLVKKFRQKKQRQWIGPTGMNQNMSFHRDHATTVRRSQVENPAASNVENEYSQPPRNSRVSAYPALEGALHRVSTQPDNSSDSDYDLHGAQRL
ncbi:T-cell surface glycoprotein CD5 [Molossus nigricans]